jgi:hypothetical protein
LPQLTSFGLPRFACSATGFTFQLGPAMSTMTAATPQPTDLLPTHCLFLGATFAVQLAALTSWVLPCQP